MKRVTPTIVGLCIALGGPILLAGPAGYVLRNQHQLATELLGQFLLWMLVVLIVALVIFWEKQSLRSIGLKTLHWKSVAWGLSLGVVLMVLTPVWAGALRWMGMAPSYERGFAKLAELPRWFLVFAAVTAGVAEETLYRGYAIERLSTLMGSYWWGGVISLAVFTLAHVPVWGSGPLVMFFISGGLMTIFYVWKRDLLACIIAHALTDIVGLLFLAPVSRVP